jgi:Recombinase zinc beta ribbon domain
MLCNAAYAGYVSGLRDKSRAIKGLHEPIVSDELFDRVQEVRSWRTRVVKPGRPSEEYLLRKLLCCERCGARMHGCRTGREAMRRYQCSTRRHHGDCEQKMTPAQPLEEQLIDWLHDFQPDRALRQLVLDTIQTQSGTHPGEDAERRRELTAQLERLRDLYVMGDMTKPQYAMRRQMMEEELQRTKPPTDPDLGRAQTILEDFARFWNAEPEPAERRKLILSLFAQVWAKDNQIVAVKPNPAFANYFTAASEVRATHPKADAGDEATNTGATGVEPCPDTARRMPTLAGVFAGRFGTRAAGRASGLVRSLARDGVVPSAAKGQPTITAASPHSTPPSQHSPPPYPRGPVDQGPGRASWCPSSRCPSGAGVGPWSESTSCVAFFGADSRVLVTTLSTCSSVIVRGLPGRGSSASPSSRR